MITGPLKSQVDTLWNAFWAGGIANPLEVVEQITYLLFLRGLDEQQTLAERKARATGEPMARPIFPEGHDGIALMDDDGERTAPGLPYADMRWSKLRNDAPERQFMIMDRHVFPFFRSLSADQV